MRTSNGPYLSQGIEYDWKSRALAAEAERERLLQHWDSWRSYIASGGEGDWPRLAFESVLENLVEQIDAANKRALKAETERDALKADAADLRSGEAK
jgi:hypothetical protein